MRNLKNWLINSDNFQLLYNGLLLDNAHIKYLLRYSNPNYYKNIRNILRNE